MVEILKKAWSEVLQPMLQRPNRLQVAALCFRRRNGAKQVLLVTSRGTGRWILPKGWPMEGMDAGEAALQEAWEEAGVRKGRIRGGAIGSYTYDKTLDNGWSIEVDTLVFPVEVESLLDDFPESDERIRRWVAPADAANMVNEPQLQSLLRDL